MMEREVYSLRTKDTFVSLEFDGEDIYLSPDNDDKGISVLLQPYQASGLSSKLRTFAQKAVED